MTAENNLTHGWTEKRAMRAGSRDDAWAVQLVLRVLGQELQDALRPLEARIAALELRMDQRLVSPLRTYSEAKE
jgi:hypothetical protein